MPASQRLRILNAGLVLLIFATLVYALFPGRFDGDSINQYHQGLGGYFDDNHSPMRAAVIGLLAHLGKGPGPMFVLQLLMWSGGVLLVSDALIAAGRPRAGLAISILTAAPFLSFDFLDIQADAALTATLALLLGILVRPLLQRRRLTWIEGAAAAVLLLYGLDIRANAAFFLAPLWFLAWPIRKPGFKPLVACVLAGALVFGAALGARTVIDYGVLKSARAHLIYALAVFDLAAVTKATGEDASRGLIPGFKAASSACYTPTAWDPFLAGACKDVAGSAQGLVATRAGYAQLMRAWTGAVRAHPVVYLAHRAAHFACLVRFDCYDVQAMAGGWGQRPWDEPNMRRPRLGLALGAAAEAAWRGVLGFGALWLVLLACELAAALLALSLGGFAPAPYLAGVLALAGLVYTAAFAVVGVADQLRYLHPVMFVALVAAPLAVAALLGGPERAAARVAAA